MRVHVEVISLDRGWGSIHQVIFLNPNVEDQGTRVEQQSQGAASNKTGGNWVEWKKLYGTNSQLSKQGNNERGAWIWERSWRPLV